MLRIQLTLFFAVLALSPLHSILAQTETSPAEAKSINAEDRVQNAPYSAQRRFTSISTLADGTISRSESSGSEARDMQGRTYSAGERRWTTLEGGKRVIKSEMLFRISDPVANTETKWSSNGNEVKVITWSQKEPARKPESTEPCNPSTIRCKAVAAQGIDNCQPCNEDAAFEHVEILGTKSIEGVVVEGTRSSYTVSTGQDHNDKPITVVHERWYCPDLKIVVLETNDDPGSGKTINQLVNIVRGEPDVTKYQPPADYVVHKYEISW